MYILSGNGLLINLEYQWSDSRNCEGVTYNAVYNTAATIETIYDSASGDFTGTLNDEGDYTGPTIPCETLYPYNVNRSISIYRE